MIPEVRINRFELVLVELDGYGIKDYIKDILIDEGFDLSKKVMMIDDWESDEIVFRELSDLE